jgi:signal transduction histidine kinase
LVVLQIVLGCQRRYLGTLASIASYIGVAALAYVYVKDASGSWPLPSASAALPILPWILMSVSFACFAFIVLVEAEKMLQKIGVAQQFDLSATNHKPLDEAPIATGVDTEVHRLRAINRNLEMITYALSHDLRAPLRAIEGFSRSLLEDAGDSMPAQARRDVQEICSGVDRMQRMVTQWLTFIRGDQNAMHCELVDLSQLARDVALELRTTNRERKTAINVEPGLTIFGDAQLLRELLQNLMGNAWKFTQQNDANALIEVGSYGNSFQTNYFVRDNGAGFSAADGLKLFTPFVRLHSGQQYEGSGIGLAIARRIVDNHGGRIWAQGQPGLGATFSFALPNPTVASGPSSATIKAAESRSVFDSSCASRQ